MDRRVRHVWVTGSLVAVFLLAGCGGGGGGGGVTPPPAAFSQADLTGTWDIVNPSAGPVWYWTIGRMTVDASGNISVIQALNSDGSTYGPPSPPMNIFSRVLVDSSGILTAYDTSVSPPSLNADYHGILSSGKQIVVTTETDPTPSNPPTQMLTIARKQNPSVVFGNADIRGKSFVYHGLYLRSEFSGMDNVWELGFGSVNGSGQLTITNITNPYGAQPVPPPNFANVTVDSSGYVYGDANFGFLGFLTNDKNNIFGIVDTIASLPGPRPMFMVMNFLGGTYVPSDLGGNWWYHFLQNGPPVWGRGKFSVNPATGAVTYDNTTTFNSYGPVTNATGEILTLDGSGRMTNLSYPSYDGQMSAGKDFYVRTRTGTVGYSISIAVR